MSQKVTSVAIFTDCDDKNARFRQSLRSQKLFGVTPIITGVTSASEAGFHIVDALDAALNVESSSEDYAIILANIAPRDGEVRGRELNGTHFCYFWVNKTLVALTFSKSMLALVKKLSLTDRILAVDIPEVTEQAVRHGLLEEHRQKYICETQFRSFEFLPRLAHHPSHQRGPRRDRRRAASCLVARLSDAALFKPRGQPEHIAARRIRDVHGDRRRR